MKAIILAAGKGTRLLPFTNHTHKALLTVREKSMIEEQIDVLHSLGVQDIAVVVGYKKEKIIEALGNKVRYYENIDFASTNSVYSLWLAKDFLDDDILILNGDLVVQPEILRDLIDHPSDMAKVVAVGKFNPTGHNAVVKGKLIIDTGSQYSKEETIGEYAGMNKVSKNKVEAVKAMLDRYIAEGKVGDWYETALNSMLKEGHEMEYVDTKGRWWFEIDFQDELEAARKFFEDSKQ